MTEGVSRNLLAERAVLGAALMNAEAWPKVAARTSEASFTHPGHITVYRAARELARTAQEINPVTVFTEIGRDETIAARFDTEGGAGLLGDLTTAGIPTRAVDAYIDLVLEAQYKREIARAGEELLAMASNGSTSADLAVLLRSYSTRMARILEPTTKVRTVDVAAALSAELPPVPWIADGWLGAGDFVIFAGEWATGKSVVALDLAISVAASLPWMGRIPIAKSGHVLYVDEENNARNITRRLKRMIAGRDIAPVDAENLPLRYLTKNALRLDSDRGRAALRAELEATRPILCVLDSLIRFHTGEENSNAEMAALFSDSIIPLATEFGCAFVVLDHMTKPNKDSDKFDAGHRVRGAGDKAGAVDGLWTLEGDRENDSRTLSCRKNRWEDSLPPAMTTKWRVSEDESAAWVEASDAVLSAEATVQNVLGGKSQGMFSTELTDALVARGVAKRTAIRSVKRMVSRGVVERRDEPGKKVRYWIGTLDVNID